VGNTILFSTFPVLDSVNIFHNPFFFFL